MHDQSLVPGSGGLANQPNLSGADSDRQLIAQWLLRHQSPHTRSAYAGDPRLATVTVRHLQAWVSHLEETLAPSTVNRKLASLRSLLGYGQQTGYLPFNVGTAVRQRRIPDRPAERILPERDCLNLLAATGNTIQGACNTALLSFLYYTGCRGSEACGLQWRNLNLEDPPTVAIHGKGAHPPCGPTARMRGVPETDLAQGSRSRRPCVRHPYRPGVEPARGGLGGESRGPQGRPNGAGFPPLDAARARHP